jgi:hypothetical protein
VTNAQGRLFISYKRERAKDIELLLAALHDLGIPTWQDLKDLEERQTETALREVLLADETAGVLAWLTPEVEHSNVIRKIELPLAVERVRRDDGFAFIPVAAGGLPYARISAVCGDYIGTEAIETWNVRKVDADPITHADAYLIAVKALGRRIKAIHRQLPSGDPVRIEIHTRSKPAFTGTTAIAFDWMHRFTGRSAGDDCWRDMLLPSLTDVRNAIEAHAPGRRVIAHGMPSIPAALALGATFICTRPTKLAWLQKLPGHEGEQLWSTDVALQDSGFSFKVQGRDAAARDLAVLVSVSSDVETAFGHSKPTLPPFRAVAKVSKPGGPVHRIGSAGEAADVASKIREGILAAREQFRDLGAIHLFMSVPAGIAVMLGQQLNSFGAVHGYEYISEAGIVGRYQLEMVLRPSA